MNTIHHHPQPHTSAARLAFSRCLWIGLQAWSSEVGACSACILLLFLDRPQAIKFDGLRPVKKQEQKVNLKEGSHLSPHGQSSPETTYTAGFRLLSSLATLDLRRGYATSCPPNQVNDSKKGSNGAAGCRSGNLHSERGYDGSEEELVGQHNP